VNCKYPWTRLKKIGDSFIWRDRADERSLRSQAHKQSRIRGCFVSVSVKDAHSLRVRLESR
jgi:hypothetical protein